MLMSYFQYMQSLPDVSVEFSKCLAKGCSIARKKCPVSNQNILTKNSQFAGQYIWWEHWKKKIAYSVPYGFEILKGEGARCQSQVAVLSYVILLKVQNYVVPLFFNDTNLCNRLEHFHIYEVPWNFVLLWMSTCSLPLHVFTSIIGQ